MRTYSFTGSRPYSPACTHTPGIPWLQALVFLISELASQPAVRSCAVWLAEPLAVVRRTSRSAARHVRTYLHGALSERFSAADTWGQDERGRCKSTQ